MGQKRSQCLWGNCKKPAELNGIYIEKSQMQTGINTQTEENEVNVG